MNPAPRRGGNGGSELKQDRRTSGYPAEAVWGAVGLLQRERCRPRRMPPSAQRQSGSGAGGRAQVPWVQPDLRQRHPGVQGALLGALLCRDEATSDSACSTLEAATDVAWMEPAGLGWGV